MKKQTKENTGLKFSRFFTKDHVSPFDEFKYELRKSVIRNPHGDAVFQMDNVEVPEANVGIF